MYPVTCATCLLPQPDVSTVSTKGCFMSSQAALSVRSHPFTQLTSEWLRIANEVDANAQLT